MAISKWHCRAEPLSDPDHFPPNRKSRIHFGRFSMPIPSSRPVRITVGLALCVGGLLGFLPILGFWMLPLGLLVLSIDLAPVRRFRRRLEIWWGRRRQKQRGS
jgi:hypothetical protein